MKKKILIALLLGILLMPSFTIAEKVEYEVGEPSFTNADGTEVTEKDDTSSSSDKEKYEVDEPTFTDADGKDEIGFRASSVNFARSKEKYNFFYEGELRFRPSYKTKPGDGSGLKPYKHVCQGKIWYVRNGKKVCGPKSTKRATSKTDNKIYSVRLNCRDDLRWGKKYKTLFYRQWIYFK